QQALAGKIAERVSRFLSAACAVGVLGEAEASSWSASAFVPDGPDLSPDGEERPWFDDPLIRHVLQLGRGLLAPSAAAAELGAGPHDSSTFAGRALSVACLPLLSNGQTFGVILVARLLAERPQLDERDLQLCQHFAERAAIALDHGRALKVARREIEQRQRLAERLRVLAQASRDFAEATADQQQLLQVVAGTVGAILGDVCSVRLVSLDREWLRSEGAGIFHSDAEVAAAFRQVTEARPQRVGEGLAGQVAQSGEPLLQTVTDPQAFLESVHPAYRPLLDKIPLKHLLIVPLMSRRRCLGVLTLSRGPTSLPYDADDLRLAQELADRAALAVENALLLTDLEQRLVDIKKGEEKFRQLLESAPDAIVIIDPGGQIVLINAQTEALFGYSRRELLGQPVEMLIPSVYRARHPDLRAGYFKAPRLRHTMAAGLALFGLRKDGSEFAAEINLSPINTPEGQLVTAVIRDVTERKRLEEARERTLELETQNRQVQEASRLKSEFLANMSHELRTPLNAIIGFSALLHAGKVGVISETQTEYLGDILTSSRHLLQLINDVLDLAKVEAGRVEVRPQHVDLARLAAEVKDVLRGLAVEKKLEISVQIGEGLDAVVTDPRLLKQVLYNYLSNAIKFTPERGAIHVSVAVSSPDCFTLSVRDTGIGIKPSDIKRLFHEFQQLDSGTGKRYGGTGLGLALTKRVVEAQGGSVAVTSELGTGSVFSAELPLRPRAPLAEQE
ncbi:MAG TPA: ATP-binding protein, partial [Polyangiaceae bacterium]|nr:ATP-binding protein [Polyangiaceae bacterium]